MRKSIDGLCAIIKNELDMDPAGRNLFLFCGRRRDRIKAVYHDHDGYVLLYKRLTGTGTYKWPRNEHESKRADMETVRVADGRSGNRAAKGNKKRGQGNIKRT